MSWPKFLVQRHISNRVCSIQAEGKLAEDRSPKADIVSLQAVPHQIVLGVVGVVG